jgi:PEP-CTERM motif
MATMKRVFIMACLFLIPALSKADSVWTYQSQELDGYTFSGNTYSGPDCECTIRGTVEFSSIAYNSNSNGLGNSTYESYSFTDGTHTLTNLNSAAFFDPFGQNTTLPFTQGNYTAIISGASGVEFYIKAYDISEATDFILTSPTTEYGYEEGHPGTWTEVSDGDHDGDDPVSTPEPASLLLLGAGIAALALTISLQKFRAA